MAIVNSYVKWPEAKSYVKTPREIPLNHHEKPLEKSRSSDLPHENSLQKIK